MLLALAVLLAHAVLLALVVLLEPPPPRVPRGFNAVNRLLGTAADAGLVPAVERIDFIRGTKTT